MEDAPGRIPCGLYQLFFIYSLGNSSRSPAHLWCFYSLWLAGLMKVFRFWNVVFPDHFLSSFIIVALYVKNRCYSYLTCFDALLENDSVLLSFRAQCTKKQMLSSNSRPYNSSLFKLKQMPSAKWLISYIKSSKKKLGDMKLP